MLRSILILSIFFSFSQQVIAQGNWLRFAGQNNNEETKDAVFDSNGALVMTGFFNGIFNTGVGTLTTSGNTDIFIMKTNDAGDPIWAVKAGGPGVDRANAIAKDNSGNTYITGYFQSSATFGSINVTGSGYEAYAAKIDQNGNFIWVTTFGGTFGDIGHDIAVDNSGNVIITGEYKGTATFGPDVITSMNNSVSGLPTYDVFITKLNSSGNFVWTRDGNANLDDRGLAVTTDATGNIYVAGQFSEDITFQSLHASTLLNAGFIISYNAAGTELWFDKMWGGQILITDIKWGGSNIYITGDYQNTLLVEDINGIQSFVAQDAYNIFTARFNESGDLGWLTTNYSTSELHSTQLALDASNNVYITGDFNCTYTEMNDFYGNSTFLSLGFEDVHCMKFNTTGTFQWARQFASNKPDYCETVTIKTADKPVLAGYYEGIFYVPSGTGFTYLPGQQVNFSEVNCGDANYGNFAKATNGGQRDIFWTSPYDPNRDPFDYFEKNPGLACDLNTYEPCIGDEIPFNDCLDTLEGCSPLTAQLNDFMLDNVAPFYSVSWSSGASGLTASFSTEGYFTATTTTEDACYSWTDSIYISLFPNPDPPTISDSWGYNDHELSTFDIDTCDADSVFVWATPDDPGDVLVWMGNPNEINDSTISVPTSGTYSVYSINSFGCISAQNSIDIVINNFALEDTLDPHIIFNDSQIADTDSTLTCILPFCTSVFLIDSAFTNQWATLPNLYSVWYVDGIYVDTLDHNSDDSTLVQSPTNMNICVNSVGWHVIESHLVNECGDTVDYFLSDSFYVDLIPTPFLEVNGPPGACPGDTVMIYADFYTPTASWSGSQIIVNYGDSALAVFNAQTGININVTVDTTVQGVTCYNSASYNLPGIPTPQVTVDPIDGVVCPGDSVLLTVNAGIAWQWIGPTGDSLGTQVFQYATDIGEYFCYVTTAAGCVVASQFESTIAYSSPTLYLWDPVICVDDSALIQVLGPSNTVINWLSPLSGSSFQNYAPTSGWYYAETSFCGITKVDSVFVIVSLPLENWDMPNDTTICPYDTVVVYAPHGFNEYYWNGVAGTDTYFVTDSGSYYLEVVDSVGCTDISDTLYVGYHALPAAPVATDTTICPGGDAILNAIAAGTISWYTSGGSFLQNGSPFLVNNVNANVNYLVTNTGIFCESLPDIASITLFIDNVTSDFDINDTCGSLSIQVENTGSTGLSYLWYFGDGGTATGNTATHAYAGTGTYTISLVTVDPVCGFEDSTSQQVTVYGQTLSIINNVPTCYQFSDASITINIINNIGGEVILMEDDLGLVINPGGTNTANNLNAGWYYYFVTLGPGCTVVDSIEILDPPQIDVALDLYPPLCFGGVGSAEVDTVFNWQGDYDDISFHWNPNPAGIGGIGADSSFNMAAGTYVLQINDGNGCSNTIDFIMTQPSQLTLVQFGMEPASCRVFSYQNGNGVVFAAATGGTPDYTYLWTNLSTGATSNNSTWGGLNPADFMITVTDDNGCILQQTITLDSLNPIADFDMSSLGFTVEWEGDAPLEVHFGNLSQNFYNVNDPNGDTTFFWNFNYDQGPWVISHDVNQSYDTTYTIAGTYTICLTALNKNGCSDTLCQDIIVYDPVYLDPPNIFTPDGDGINDEFTFEFRSQGIETFECILVNRWGVTIREFNDIHNTWDGRDKNGDEVPDGVYFYVYHGVGFNSVEVAGQGTVTIVRGQ